MNSSLPQVSVIIPVYNDADRLQRCLQSVESQSYLREHYEVIVVDNGSTDHIVSVQTAFPNMRFVREHKRGPAAARNTGVKVAAHDIIAFTDADCMPEPNWLEQGVRAFLELPTEGIVGGRVMSTFVKPDHPTFIERYDAITYFRQQWNVEVQHFSATANTITHRSLFNQIGGFDERYHTAALEDIDWGLRAHKAGYPLAYSADMIVKHPARQTLRSLLWVQQRQADYGHILVENHQRSRGPIMKRTLGTPGSRLRTLLVHPLGSPLHMRIRLLGLYVLESCASVFYQARAHRSKKRIAKAE